MSIKHFIIGCSLTLLLLFISKFCGKNQDLNKADIQYGNLTFKNLYRTLMKFNISFFKQKAI